MVDFNGIKNDVESILIHSQDYPFDLDATNLMLQWEKAKKDIIKLFGGETIIKYPKPIKIFLSEEQRRKRFNEFLITLDDNGILTADLESFLRSNEKGFFDNKVLSPYPSFNITLGSKLSKSFKRFISNPKTIRWAQDTASRYIQENKIEGYLYLSVDPRDFLTLSENNEKWWSCQTLDGDYRAGNLSYMVDQTTIIAYLSNGKQEHLKCLPANLNWNSKKWRMLIHTDMKNCIYYNKQYPYESDDLLLSASTFLTSRLTPKFTAPTDYGFKVVKTQRDQTMLVYNQLNAGGRVFDTRDIIDTSDYLGYCDLVSSSSYAPIVSSEITKLWDYKHDFVVADSSRKHEEEARFKDIFGIKIGENATCPCCGQETLKRDSSFLCPDCIAEKDADEDFYLSCDSCYHKIYDEDEIFFINDVPYCKECYNAMQRENSILEEEN